MLFSVCKLQKQDLPQTLREYMNNKDIISRHSRQSFGRNQIKKISNYLKPAFAASLQNRQTILTMRSLRFFPAPRQSSQIKKEAIDL